MPATYDAAAAHQDSRHAAADLPATGGEATSIDASRFHVATLVLTTVGVFMLLGAARRGAVMPTIPQFVGQLLLGWGIFNLVEGVVDHHLLELPHVRDVPAHMPLYDWLFLGIGGALFIAIGWLLIRPRGDRSRPDVAGIAR